MEPMIVTLFLLRRMLLPSPMMGRISLCLIRRGKVAIGNHEHILSEGDSFCFDPCVPHGQWVVDENSSFLTAVQN